MEDGEKDPIYSNSCTVPVSSSVVVDPDPYPDFNGVLGSLSGCAIRIRIRIQEGKNEKI
jgi:hypothetical protein